MAVLKGAVMQVPERYERCNLGKYDIGTTRFDGR